MSTENVRALANAAGTAGATFSSCDQYRFRLWRKLDEREAPTWFRHTRAQPGSRCMFLMLNPSTATHHTSDNTVTRCINYATDWGYQYLDVGNLFALRSTDPSELYGHADPIGPGNDAHLLAMAKEAALVVCSWGGTHGHYMRRAQVVANMLRSAGVVLHALRLCADGTPGHPLYLPKSLVPLPWAA